MISKFSVKKPLTVIMALLMIVILGCVSFSNMKTDLLPNMDMPYVAIITTYIGASPEKVETALTKPLEQALATTNGIENLSSISSENYSAIILEFSQNTNLDSAIVEMSSKVSTITDSLGETVGTPMYMKINPDLLPVVIASVDYEGLERKEIAKRVSEDIIPAFERTEGVASVSATGLIENTMKITINQDKIDKLNNKVIAGVDEKLADTQEKLQEAQKQLDKGKTTLEATKNEQNEKLAVATVALQSGMTQLNVISTALTAIQNVYGSANDIFDSIDDELDRAKKDLNSWKDYKPQIVAMLNEISSVIKTAQRIVDKTNDALDKDAAWYEEVSSQLTQLSDSLLNIANRIDKAKKLIKNTMTAKQGIEELQSLLSDIRREYRKYGNLINESSYEISIQIDELKKQQELLETGKVSFTIEMAAAKSKLEAAQTQLDAGMEEFEKAKKKAYEKAGLTDAITVDTISKLISAENFSMPVGSISEDNIMYSVKVGDLFENNTELTEWEIFNIPVGDVGVVKLENIADIEYLDNSDSMYAKVNGNNGIILTMDKQSTYSTTDVAHNVQKTMKKLEKTYQGLSIISLSDQGEYIDLVISSVIQSLVEGGALAILILLLFLKDLRPTFIIAISIPASLLFAIVLMYFSGVSINIISLSGLALGVGMLVDNSIVVVENIYRLKMLGMPIKEAAIDGAKQVGGAIIASTLTTVSVFLPIVFTTGITRQIFSDMGLTIAYSLIASLIVALTVVPTLGSLMLGKVNKAQSKVSVKIINGYISLLDKALNKKAIVIVLVILLLGLSIFGATQMGTEFIPESDTKQMALTLEMPIGSTSEQTREMSEKVIDRLTKLDYIDTVAAMQGGSGTFSILSAAAGGERTVSMYILLKESRKITSQQATDDMTKKLDDLECDISIATASMNMSMLTGEGIEVTIKGTSLDDLQKAADEVGAMISSIDGTYDITTGTEETTQEIRIIVDKNAAMARGYTVAQVYMKVSQAVTCESTATSLDIENDEYSVVVAKGEKEKVTVNQLKDIEFEVIHAMSDTADTEETEYVKLEDIAEIKYADTPKAINHENQIRTMSVKALIDSNHNIGKVSKQLETKLNSYKFPGDCYYETAGENEYILSSLRDLIYMILISIAFIYMIMVAQFQSLKSPFIVMFTIPLAFTGGLLLLWILGFNISIVAMLGILVLAGVVVNNGIVFVDYANQLVAEDKTVREAILQTGRDRIRPIIMTAITTILGLVTISLGIGEGTDMVQPMGIVVIGGLMYATLLTLFVIPVLYEVFNKKKHSA